jgi:hypothetical protein
LTFHLLLFQLAARLTRQTKGQTAAADVEARLHCARRVKPNEANAFLIFTFEFSPSKSFLTFYF